MSEPVRVRALSSWLALRLPGVLGLVACDRKTPAEIERPPAPVSVATLITRDAPSYLDEVGKCVARETVAIQPEISGRSHVDDLSRLYIRSDDADRAGRGLAMLDLFREPATLYAFVGMLMLMGIVKKNGIMIVDFARQRVDRGEPPDGAIHEASLQRFRPILMTTLAAVAGAVPIAVGFGTDGACRRPLGLVIVGGLIASQLITLYVTR